MQAAGGNGEEEERRFDLVKECDDEGEMEKKEKKEKKRLKEELRPVEKSIDKNIALFSPISFFQLFEAKITHRYQRSMQISGRFVWHKT